MNLSLVLIVFVMVYHCVDGKGPTGQGRIVGGTKATNRYPYQVSLQVHSYDSDDEEFDDAMDHSSKWEHDCGGSIITQMHVLSAAHCVVEDKTDRPKRPHQLSVWAGSNQLNGKDGKRYFVSKLKPHHKYKRDEEHYDISIVTIKGKFEFKPGHIEAIKYSKEKIPSGTLCVLTGWGSTDHAGNSPTPNDLNELTNIPTMDTKECQDYSNDMEFVTDHNLCTKNAHEGHCFGDSGGPLATMNNTMLVGIVQLAVTDDCAEGPPDVYTRVSSFYDWIQEHTKMKNVGGRPKPKPRVLV